MNTIKISLDTIKFTSKPQRKDVAGLSTRIAKEPIELKDFNDIRGFLEAVGNNGQTFSPATFKNGNKRQEDFEQMQMFVLDFDGNISYEEVIKRSEKYELPILAVYDTFSSKEHNRFRAIFLNDTSIDNNSASKIYKNALMTIFPESDKTDSDTSKMYYGGKKLIHFDEKIPTINAESLFRNMCCYCVDKYGSDHYKRKIKEFANINHIKLTPNGNLDIIFNNNATENPGVSDFGEISPKSIICYKINNGENSPFSSIVLNLQQTGTKGFDGKKVTGIHKLYRSDIISSIKQKCNLFSELVKGKRKLEHDELFGIATNIINVESGSSLLKKLLSDQSELYSHEKLEKWKNDIKYMNQMNYKPEDCNKFCAYKDICNHSSNLLSTARLQSGKIERIEGYNEQLYSIEESQDDLACFLEKAINSDEKKWFIIKAQTAVGKTETYINALLEHPEKKFLIVVPTNVLKREVADRAKGKGIDLLVSPSMDELKDIPADLQSQIDSLRETGRSHLVHPLVQKYIEKEPVESLSRYYKEMQSFDDGYGSAITTHRKFLNMFDLALSKFNEIIIDEDIILGSIAPDQCSISISQLKYLKKRIKEYADNEPVGNKQYKRLIKKIKTVIKESEDKKSFKVPGICWDWGKCGSKTTKVQDIEEFNDELDDTFSIIDIPAFCHARFFMVVKAKDMGDALGNEDMIVFLRPYYFHPRKYIMMSATVDKDICEYCFGRDRVEFCECRQARNAGKLIQYHERSMSRCFIDNHPDVISKIRSAAGFENVITFKKYNCGDMYFGNAIGCDSMKGQDITVIGTPHKVDFVYKLLPLTLGLDIDVAEKVKKQVVSHNGYRFSFTTYEDEVLQKFHMWMIESELEQAVGRARLTRCDCTVKLYSNFPMKQAEMRKLDFEI